jgi:acyl dehydratase
MLERRERLWDFAAVEPGQAGAPAVVNLTAAHISRFALLAQNQDSRYHEAGSNREYGGALAAMPTMALAYAPLLREEIAEANGFVALEQSRTARRQTPFAKCELRWSRPVLAGDTITSIRRVLEKYERRGSRFVTFRVEASNQRSEKVAEYDYTCIFEYAGAQKELPGGKSPAQPSPESKPPPQGAAGPPRLLKFAEVSVGHRLPSLSITESQEIINRKNDFRLAGRPSASNIHTDEEFARQNIFGGTVNSGPATMSYVDQMLQLSFPLQAFYDSGRLLMRAIEPFRAGDTVTFSGEITGKRKNPPSVPPYQGGRPGGRGMVECRVKGINQRGDLVCLSDATLFLPE